MAFLWKAANDVKYLAGQMGVFWQKSDSYSYDWDGAKGIGLSVGTYNINFGGVGMASVRQRVIDAMREMDCDCVLVQECSPEWAEVLRHGLTAMYPHMEFCSRPEMPSSGMGVLAKQPFTTKVLDTFSRVEGACFHTMVATFEKDGKEVQCVNVHLRPPLDPNATISSPSNTNPIRLAELRYITSCLDLTVPTVIGGDFNEQEAAPGLMYLAKNFTGSGTLIPSYKETHRWPLGPATLMKRLDHLLCSKQLCLVTAGVLCGYENVSDHQPVVAALTFKS